MTNQLHSPHLECSNTKIKKIQIGRGLRTVCENCSHTMTLAGKCTTHLPTEAVHHILYKCTTSLLIANNFSNMERMLIFQRDYTEIIYGRFFNS